MKRRSTAESIRDEHPPDAVAYRHVTVMLQEVIEFLNCRSGKIYVDCTMGGAGHTVEILKRIGPKGIVIALDQDQDAIRHAGSLTVSGMDRLHVFHANFSRIAEVLHRFGLSGADGIVADLGLSFHHIEGSGRGFSFLRDEPLDMRMDDTAFVTADDLVNGLDDRELAHLLFTYGEERRAGAIVRAIVRERPIHSSRRLAEVIASAVRYPNRNGRGARGKHIHPATQSFMALRIAVNRELDHLAALMDAVPDILNPGGRICMLTFHSLEDRIVKHRFKGFEKGCHCPPGLPVCACGGASVLKVITKKALSPSEREIQRNPMARSARLRVAERL